MVNAVLLSLGFAVTGFIFAVLINIVGNRQDREATQAKHR